MTNSANILATAIMAILALYAGHKALMWIVARVVALVRHLTRFEP